ncbi:MAG: protein-tyrosine-phosphatase [Sandaracinaceae bacterium]
MDEHSDPGARGGPQASLHPELRAYAAALPAGFDAIPEPRRADLERLAAFVRDRRASAEEASLTFICTHNSRRSHMSQLWAATAAAWYGVDGVGTYSGGTEATAFNPRAVAALQRAGFRIESPGGDNPHYQVTYGPEGPPMECFSKVYDDPFNPQEGFAAVMTCTAADEACPFVAGAALRVSLPYVDPKEADDTPAEASRYDERLRQIATEMMYLFSEV